MDEALEGEVKRGSEIKAEVSILVLVDEALEAGFVPLSRTSSSFQSLFLWMKRSKSVEHGGDEIYNPGFNPCSCG